MDLPRDRKGNWIQTFSGGALWPLDPRPGDYRFEDIAHAGALENRFSGHSLVPYSVNEHQVRVSIHLEGLVRGLGWPTPRIVLVSLGGLFHDAHEALGWRDLARPIKREPEFRFYCEGAERCQRAVETQFGIELDQEMSDLIHYSDGVLLATEKRDLMVKEPYEWGPLPPPLEQKIVPWGWKKAKSKYTQRYLELKKSGGKGNVQI